MKAIWKWLLGIVIVLVVIVALGFFAWRTLGVVHMTAGFRGAYENYGPRMSGGFEHNGSRVGPRNGYNNFPHRMMGGYALFPFGGLFLLSGLLRLIFPLGMLALVAYLSYKQGKKAGMAAALAGPAAEPTPISEPESTPVPKKRSRKVA